MVNFFPVILGHGKALKIWDYSQLRIFNFPIFIFWVFFWAVRHLDLQVSDRPKKSFKSGQICRKDAQWAETNEKSIFRYYFPSYRENLSKIYSFFGPCCNLYFPIRLFDDLYARWKLYYAWINVEKIILK